VLAEDAADYIRHARHETLRSIGAELHPELTEPLGYAVYLLAYDADGRTIGMAESCFLEQHYASWEQAPYAPFCDLEAICPFAQLASIRTVYAEPEARRHPGLYLKLILGSAYIFRSLGASHSMATTDASNAGLARLYDKTGGRRLATFKFKDYHHGEIAAYAFDLDALLRHPWAPRMMRDLEVSADVVQMVRARSRQQVFEAT
jgi:hypothetical protein